MYVVAGLGNPTEKYEKTRHNIGFDAVDAIAAKYNIDIRERKHRALCGRGVIEGVKVMLIKPLTFMNLSGECIAQVLDYYQADPETDLLVIYDDISLPPGALRIRKKGSAGGHNGVKDIIAMTDTDVFARIKIGVGEKPPQWDLVDYVLSRFSKEDRESVDGAIQDAVGAAALIVQGRIEEAMNLYNRKKQ